MTLDPESEELLAQERRMRGITPILTTEPNGKRWWKETWGKALGMVLGSLTLLALYWAGGKVMAFGTATTQVYSLPPRVKAIEDWKAALPSPTPALAPDKVDRLITLLEGAESRAKQERKR